MNCFNLNCRSFEPSHAGSPLFPPLLSGTQSLTGLTSECLDAREIATISNHPVLAGLILEYLVAVSSPGSLCVSLDRPTSYQLPVGCPCPVYAAVLSCNVLRKLDPPHVFYRKLAEIFLNSFFTVNRKKLSSFALSQ